MLRSQRTHPLPLPRRGNYMGALLSTSLLYFLLVITLVCAAAVLYSALLRRAALLVRAVGCVCSLLYAAGLLRPKTGDRADDIQWRSVA